MHLSSGEFLPAVYITSKPPLNPTVAEFKPSRRARCERREDLPIFQDYKRVYARFFYLKGTIFNLQRANFFCSPPVTRHLNIFKLIIVIFFEGLKYFF